MADQRSRLQQYLEFQQSLLQDQLRDIKQSRAQQRQTVEYVLTTKIPNPIESLLTLDQTRLLRIYRIHPSQLTKEEMEKAIQLYNYLQRIHLGGCYNMNAEQEKILREHNRLFSFNIPGISVTFCLDITGPIQNQLVNASLGMVDIFIDVTPEERYRYPFDEATSKAYLDQLRILGIDPAKFLQMRFPDIEFTEEQIQFTTLQLNPNAFQ